MLALAIVYALIAGSAGWLFSFISGRFGQNASIVIMILSAICLLHLSRKQLKKNNGRICMIFNGLIKISSAP